MGAFVTTMLIYALAYQKGVSPVKMILSGMAVSALFGAFNDIIKTFFADALGNASGFLVGGLNGTGWDSLTMMFPYALTGILVCAFLPAKMNILMLGDETANSLGPVSYTHLDVYKRQGNGGFVPAVFRSQPYSAKMRMDFGTE